MLNRDSLIRLVLCVVIIAEAVFLGFPTRASAISTSYYVSPSGNDNNDGTSPATAWQTINKVSATTFEAGDQILFEGGQTFTGGMYFDSSDAATAQAPITISSYGTGRATISSGVSDGIFVYNSAGYDITNLNFVGSGATTSNGAGISFYTDLPGNVKLDHITIDQVESSGFDIGINIGAWNNLTGFKNVQITNVLIHHNQRTGISTYSQSTAANENVYVGHSTAHSNDGDPSLNYNSGSGITLGGVNGGTVEYSSAYNNGAQCTAGECGVGIWTYNSNNIAIQFNESYNNKTGSNVDGGGFDLDGGVTNSIVQYNYAHGNDGPGFALFQYSGAPTFSNNTLRYNISENDARKNTYGGITLWGANTSSLVQNSNIYGNTVFTSKPTGTSRAFMALGSNISNVNVLNNIFISTQGQQLISSPAINGLNFYGNNYWSSGAPFAISWGNKTIYSSLSAWRSASGKEMLSGSPTGTQVNPLLTNPGNGGTIGNPLNLASLNAYKLQATSPLINQALDYSLFGINPGNRDFYGSSLPQSGLYDIGAHEFDGSIPTPTPSSSPTPSPTLTPSPSASPSPTPTPTGDTQAPTVNITSPTNGSTVPKSSVVTIQATASDNIGVNRVEFYANGKRKCTDLSAPYDCAWSVPSNPNTLYTLQAKAFDAQNNTATHQITVTSSN